MYNITIHTISFSRGYVPGVDNKKFREIILKHPKPIIKDPAYFVEDDSSSDFPMNPEFEKVLNHISAQFTYVHHKKLKLLNFWGHVNEKNMSTVTHNHIEKEDYEGDHHLSGTYYVQVPPKSGHLVLLYPYNSYVTHKFPIMPKPGEFFLFPSTLDHHVTRNRSNEVRISVSFNFKIIS
jgi:hypothetical protein|tara:strand:- start:232 stop:768 length:537 start_codon:yes stop_codon:yes gene_type:complete